MDVQIDRKAQAKLEREAINLAIRQNYNSDTPNFSFICGGMRRISVNPDDRRARKMLLKNGIRYYSKNQLFVYACASYLPLDLFLDVGTNYGECLFSLPLYCKTRARGFEANPEMRDHLERSKRYNSDIQAEYDIVAVSGVAGQSVSFFVDAKWSGKSSLSGTTGRATREHSVTTTTVDAEVEKAGGGTTILLKVDVEGFEPSVFDGAKRTIRETPNLIALVEYDSDFLEANGSNAEEFFDALEEDCEVYDFKKDILRPVWDFAQLQKLHAKKPKIHTDLILTKFSDNSIRSAFQTRIAAPFSELRSTLWQL